MLRPSGFLAPTPRFAELRTAIDANGGQRTVTMAELRDRIGRDRLGVNVLGQIRLQLKRAGLATRQELTTNQNDRVRLYSLNSAAARIIAAAFTPGPGGDKVLRACAENDFSKDREKLDRIRELLDEDDEDVD